MVHKNALIVLCGMDGAGKSTVAQELQEKLRDQKIAIDYVHGHTYSVSSNSFGFSEKIISKTRRLLMFFIPFAYIDNLFTYFNKYRRSIRKRPVISDRYFYDKVARLVFYKIMPHWIESFFLKMIPKADFAFFLAVSPKTAIERKGEYSLQQYRRFNKIYLRIADIIGANVIDVERPLNQVTDEMLSIIANQDRIR